MKRIFLIRHGLSLANTRYLSKDDEYIFDGDIPLTEKGFNQAKETGKFLKKYCIDNNIDLNKSIIWCSPFLRTEDTAKTINEELGIKKLYLDPRISELDFGLFDQRSYEDSLEIDEAILKYLDSMNKSKRGKFYARRPNGEAPSDVYNRLSTFIETLYRDKEENVFIVSHGITLRTFIMRMMHYDLKWYFNERNSENASVRLLELENDKLIDKEYIFIPNVK